MSKEEILIDLITKYDGGLEKIKKKGDALVATFSNLEKIGGKAFNVTKEVSFAMSKQGEVMTSGAKVTKMAAAASSKFMSILGRLRMTMLMFGLSIMFAGMQLKRYGQMVMSSTVGAFRKIIETTNDNSTALQQLSAWWEYLKFTIGSAINRALEPLMPFLIRIISWFSELVQTHPEAVFWGIIGALVAGGLLFFLGQTITLISGIIGLIEKLGKINFVWSTLFGWIGVIIIGVIALIEVFNIWSDKGLSTSDKIIASIMTIATAITIIALLFGAWPVALVAAIVAMGAGIVLFKDYVINQWSWLVQNVTLKMLELQRKWFEVIGKIISPFSDKGAKKISDFLSKGIDLGIEDLKKKIEANNAEFAAMPSLKEQFLSKFSLGKEKEKILGEAEKFSNDMNKALGVGVTEPKGLEEVQGVDFFSQFANNAEQPVSKMQDLKTSTDEAGMSIGVLTNETLPAATEGLAGFSDETLNIIDSIDGDGKLKAVLGDVNTMLPTLKNNVSNITTAKQAETEAILENTAAWIKNKEAQA